MYKTVAAEYAIIMSTSDLMGVIKMKFTLSPVTSLALETSEIITTPNVSLSP